MTYDDAFNRLIDHEGGYVNDPNDPGGETKFGISKREYPNLIIKELKREDAYNIFRRDFWNKINADKLYDGVAFQLFDFAINSGVQTSIRYFQRALGVADDGFFGEMSLKASQEMSETDQIMNLNSERLEFMTRLKNWQFHGKGWARRIAKNLRYGSEDS